MPITDKAMWINERHVSTRGTVSADVHSKQKNKTESKTKLTASVLKQDQNTHKVKKNADFDGTAQNKYANLMGQHKG